MATAYRYTARDEHGRQWEVRLDVTTWMKSSDDTGFDREDSELVCDCGWTKWFFWGRGEDAAMNHLADAHSAVHQQQNIDATCLIVAIGTLSIAGTAVAGLISLATTL